MPDLIPLFPLGSALFPGAMLPLHVFEQRYRDLVHDLLERPAAERRFGVVAIRQGWEVTRTGVRALYPVGTEAHVRTVRPLPDGRFDLIAVGTRRFRLTRLDDDLHAYHCADVEWLPDEASDPAVAEALAGAVSVAFHGFVADLMALQPDAGGGQDPADLPMPADPTSLANLVAASAPLALEDQQRLLEMPDVVARLRAELSVLRRERAILAAVHSVPAPLQRFAVSLSAN